MSTTSGIQAGVTTGSSLSGGSGSLPNDPIGTLDEYGDEIFGGYSTRRLKGIFPKLLPADYSGARAAYSLRKVRSGYPDKTLPANYGDGATAAYSLRRVNAAYNGPAIKVRRSSDDAVQDIGFSDIGGLDTTALTTFVNTDVNQYTSDYSTDTDGMVVFNATLSANESVGGLDDALKVTSHVGSGQINTRKGQAFSNLNGNTHRLQAKVYIPSTNAQVDGVRVWTGYSSGVFADVSITDSWVSIDQTLSLTQGNNLFFSAKDGSSINVTTTEANVFYVKDVVVTQTTADGHVTTWYDQSGNGNSATNTTSSQQPLIVEAGSVVTENGKPAIKFDGVDDTLQKDISPDIAQPLTLFHVRRYRSNGIYVGVGYDNTTGTGYADINRSGDFQSYYGGGYTGVITDNTDQGLFFSLANGTGSAVGLDGAALDTTNAQGTHGLDHLYIASAFNAFNAPINTQELIIYASNQSDNRPFIEENINVYYDIYAQDEWDKESAIKVRRSSDDALQDIGFVGNELDTTALLAFVNSGEVFTNADISSATGWTLGGNTTYNASTEAFDLVGENGLTVRQGKNENGHTYAITIVLDSVTSGGIKIYAGGTQSAVISTAGTHTLNIVGGSTNNFLGVNPQGTVTCSISSFSAIDTTADGHVTTWYDQSGFGNHATNTTSTEQPLIVEAGTVVTENGKAAIDFDGVDDYLTLGGTNDAGMLGDISVFSVNKNSISGNSVVVSTGTMASSYAPNMQWGINGGIGTYTGTTSDGTTRINEPVTATNYGSQVLVSMINDEDGNLQMFADGVGSTGQAAVAPMNDANFALEVGRDSGGQRYYFSGTQQELILLDSDQSSNRKDIEWNINNHYSIYEQWNRNSALSVRRSSDDTTKQIGFDGSSDMSESEVLSFVNDASPVLDDNSGAVSAYSLRKVLTAYEGSAIKVRRSSDDELQDIGFDANGDLDTTALTTFVNAEKDIFTSDFPNGTTAGSGDGSLGTTRTTLTAPSSIGGKTDALQVTCDGSVPNYDMRVTSIDQGQKHDISFEYYIPSGNTIVEGIKWTDAAVGTFNTKGVWTSVNLTDTTITNNILRFFASSVGGTVNIGSGVTESFYIRNLSVSQTTADGHVTTWYDQTGNSDATQTTDSEQPLVVIAGAVVTEGDRPAMSLVDGQYFDNAGVDGYSRFDFFSVSKITDTTGMFLTFSTGGGKYSWVYTQNSANTTFYSSFGTPTMYSNSVLQSISDRGDVYNAYNGHKIITTLGGDTSSWDDGKFFAYSSPFGVSGTVQEIISFDSDQSSSRLGIEGNIGRYYNITGYRDGFVTKWYDQSNNDNHLENATASQQPKIVENGVMITENGKPAIEFNRTTEEDVLSAVASFSQPVTHFFVRRITNLTNGTQVPLSYQSTTGTPWGEIYFSNLFRTHFGGGYLGTFEGIEDLLLQYVFANGTDSTIAYNGAEGDTGNAGSSNVSGLHVGRNSSAGSYESNVKAQELIVYQRNASESRREIEEIINRHFRIYL